MRNVVLLAFLSLFVSIFQGADASVAINCTEFRQDIGECSVGPFDISILLDASTSVGVSQFNNKVLPFIASFTCMMNPELPNRLGLSTFSSIQNTRTWIDLKQYSDEQWFAGVQELKDQSACCECCTPFAEGMVVAKANLDGAGAPPRGRANTIQMVYVVTDGLPYQIESADLTTYPWAFYPRDPVAFKPAEYTYIIAPQQAEIAKQAGYRVAVLAIPNRNGGTPRREYFSGELPAKDTCVIPRTSTIGGGRVGQTCEDQNIPPFPIPSLPVNENLFVSTTIDLENLAGRTLEALCPASASPTFSPTNSAPSKNPTTPAPTPYPVTTSSPTKYPTMYPTSNPTQSPTRSPFKPELNSIDLYFLIDRSRSMRWVPGLCRNAPGFPANGDSIPDTQACWTLFMNFIEGLVEEVRKLPFGNGKEQVGWYDFTPNNPNRGMRVWLYGFACTGHQSEPVVVKIGESIGSAANFTAAMDFARSLTPDGGTCPGAAIEKAAAQVQGNLNSGRPFRSAILLTDGVFYDMPRPRLAAEGLFHFSTLTYSMGISIPQGQTDYGLTDEEIKRQRTQLLNFAQNQRQRVYNFGAEGLSLLDEIATEFANQLPQDAIDNLPEIENQPFFCGWTSKDRCTNMDEGNTATGVYCKWNSHMRKCLVKDNCKLSKKACEADDYCRPKGNRCLKKKKTPSFSN